MREIFSSEKRVLWTMREHGRFLRKPFNGAEWIDLTNQRFYCMFLYFWMKPSPRHLCFSSFLHSIYSISMFQVSVRSLGCSSTITKADYWKLSKEKVNHLLSGQTALHTWRCMSRFSNICLLCHETVLRMQAVLFSILTYLNTGVSHVSWVWNGCSFLLNKEWVLQGVFDCSSLQNVCQ